MDTTSVAAENLEKNEEHYWKLEEKGPLLYNNRTFS